MKKFLSNPVTPYVIAAVLLLMIILIYTYLNTYNDVRMDVAQEKYEKTVASYDLVIGKYEEILTDLTDEYNNLVVNFNTAVRKTIITDIMVDGTDFIVIIRDSQKIINSIPCPVDLSVAVYVDYIVYDNRIILRRVFDENIPAKNAFDIFQYNEDVINWNDDKLQFGQAIYRKYNEDGIYHITITGNGSLGLIKAEDGEALEYLAEVEKQDYEMIVDGIKQYNNINVDKYDTDITFCDIIRKML